MLGIDPCREDIQKVINSRFPTNAQFIACGLQDLSQNYCFDLIVFYRSFHELEGIDLSDAIVKARRLLKPDGKILIIEQDPECELFKIHDYNHFGLDLFKDPEKDKLLRVQDCIKEINHQSAILKTNIGFGDIEDFCDIQLQEKNPDELFKALVEIAIINTTTINPGKPFFVEDIMNMYLISR